MAAKKGLGKGLDTLIPSNVLDSADNKQKTGKTQTPDSVVDINKVEPNRDQPRKNFDEDVPVIIRNFTEQEIVEISIIENIQREDLNPIEEAMAYKRLLEEFNLKQDEVAEKVSKNRTTITNSLRLLKLTDDVQQMIVDGKLSTGHARAIISIEDPAKQLEIAEKIFDEKMSVREVEKYIKSLDKPAKPKKKVNESLQVVYDNIEEQLKLMLGTKVSILSKSTEGSGKLEIEFYNHDDLERIVEIIKR